ncbi:uncharacterized protein LOC111066749 [Drosophila obscura]|uniref:uncharacterized protein LOC111066749 n=1 Tax=Drosophila obscura TaxID=7282 RepID=UPI000BA0D3AD|nr:uncharacterized protein LOC111066749 [Drosophila obscura]
MLQNKATKRCKNSSLSFILLVILAMFASNGVYAPQPGPCRQLKHTVEYSSYKGTMVHRSMYLDVFAEQDANKPPTPVNFCLAVAWPPKNVKLPYIILGTDHKQYVVIYICNYSKATKSHVELINTYTAEKKPSKEALAGISEALTKNGVNETLQLMLCDY